MWPSPFPKTGHIVENTCEMTFPSMYLITGHDFKIHKSNMYYSNAMKQTKNIILELRYLVLAFQKVKSVLRGML